MEVRSIEAIIRALNTAGVKYLIVVGLAVNAHGYVRFTNDVDLVVALDSANILSALHALQSIGYAPRVPITPEQFAEPENRARWMKEKGMLVLQLWSDAHKESPVDIFVSEPFPFQEEYSRAPQFEIAPDLWAPFVSRERLIEMKRQAGRPQDLEDIRRLMLV